MTFALPPETLLHILSYLSPLELAPCYAINSTWSNLLKSNQQTLYKAIAAWSLKESDLTTADWVVRGVDGWREFCRRRFCTNLNWENGYHRIGWIKPPLQDVWRIQIDEEQDVVMTTSRLGNVYVLDAKTSEMLDIIAGVRPYAHLEYGSGFMIFDTHFGDTHEVWRRTEDMARDGQLDSLENEPSPQASSTAFSTMGLFSFYAQITSPTFIRAYRFIYPILLIGSMDSQSAFLWHIPEKRMLGTIDISSANLDLINYVEKTENHILILGLHHMSVFSISPSVNSEVQLHPPHHTLNIPSAPSAVEFVLDLALDFMDPKTAPSSKKEEPTHFTGRGVKGMMRKAVVWETEGTRSEGSIFASTVDFSFTAAHVSEGTLILTSRRGKIFIILDYHTVFEDPSLESLHTLCLDVAEPVFNLSFKYGSAVMSTRTKVLLIPASALPSLRDIKESALRKQACLPLRPLKMVVFSFGNVSAGAAHECSSVQVDRTRAMMAYNTRADPVQDSPPEARQRAGYSVKTFDFSPSL